MPVEYETFQTKPWGERLKIFNAISNEEKAQLVRMHVSRWLDSHRRDLSNAQAEIVEEWLALLKPELYVSPKTKDSMKRLGELKTRTAAILSPCSASVGT